MFIIIYFLFLLISLLISLFLVGTIMAITRLIKKVMKHEK